MQSQSFLDRFIRLRINCPFTHQQGCRDSGDVLNHVQSIKIATETGLLVFVGMTCVPTDSDGNPGVLNGVIRIEKLCPDSAYRLL